MFISIVEGRAKLTEQGNFLPAAQKLKKIDKTKGKAAFETWLRFIYFTCDKESLYKNYLPSERDQKVQEMLFPDKSVTYFKKITGLEAVRKIYIEMSMSFKEKLYTRLLRDVEEMLERVSKVELTKSARVKGKRDVTFFSETEGKEVTENVWVDVIIKIDNSDEKIKAMDTLDKILKREVILKKALKEEKIEEDLKKASQQRLFDM